jgi:hypothetical protein
MGAYVIHYLIEHHPVPPKMVLLGIWVVFFPKTFEPLIALKKLFVSKTGQLKKTNPEMGFDEENSKKNVGLWIRANTPPSEKVYVAGYSAQIQLYSERVSPSVYFNVTQTVFAKKRLFRDLLFNKAGMIVVPGLDKYSNIVDGDIRQFISRLVTESYLLDTTIENYAIYKYNRNSNY